MEKFKYSTYSRVQIAGIKQGLSLFAIVLYNGRTLYQFWGTENYAQRIVNRLNRKGLILKNNSVI